MLKHPAKIRTLVLAFACIFGCALTGFSRDDSDGIIDTINLGDQTSEQHHDLTTISSRVVNGGLGEPARELLPLDPVSYNGGSITFTLKVDPVRQNYLTAKFWGSDCGEEHGRLIAYLDGLQLGYRHEGDHDVLNQCDHDPLYKDRFVYETVALPLMRTRGKTEVTLKIAALGPIWFYGQTFDKLQKSLEAPSRGIYGVYTHTSTRFNPPADEKQAVGTPPPTRPAMDGETILAQMKATVNARLTGLMKATSTPADNAKAAEGDIQLIAEAYNTPWTTAYHNPRAIAALVKIGDGYIRPGVIGASWGGAGPLGRAIADIGRNPLLEKALDESIEVPAGIPFIPTVKSPLPGFEPVITSPTLSGKTTRMTRREAWSRMLRASVDWHRFRDRRSYTNQSMIVDFNIYTANRGLLLIDPARAIPEKQALGYVYQSIGLLPWLGNDKPDGGSEKPYGDHYYLVTRQGLSRELGFVASYGETILTFCRDMAAFTGDPNILGQLIKLQTARAYFRYPSLDADGYRTMKLTAEIDNRTAHFPQPNGAYSVCEVREAWWMEVASLAKDPLSVGITQQCLEDHQYFPRLAQRLRDGNTLGMMRNIDQYAIVQSLPPSSVRLPATDGQPDFVFSDPEDAVIALKHGDEHLYVNFYYRQEFGVSGATRILDVTPRIMRLANVQSNYEVDSSGHEWIRPDVIDMERNGGHPPPDEEIHQAWQGEVLPISKRPPGATEPKYGTWGPFMGKAAFYYLRYGNYLFAVNTTYDHTYSLPAPAKQGDAKDIVSGKTMDIGHDISVAPLTTVILYLGDQ